jgi:hypothetical protein
MYLSMNFVFFHLTVLDKWEIDYDEAGGQVVQITEPGANFPNDYLFPCYDLDDMTAEDYKEYLRRIIMANADTKKSGSQGRTKKLLSGEELDSRQEVDLLTQMVASYRQKNEPSTTTTTTDFSERVEDLLVQLLLVARDMTQFLR